MRILSNRNRWWWVGLLVTTLLVIVASFFPVGESNDSWWHLKAGKLLLEGSLGWYSTDPFTESAKDKVWVNHEWLAETLFYAAYRVGGLRSAILLKVTVLVATFLVVLRSAILVASRTGSPPPLRDCNQASSSNSSWKEPPTGSILAATLAVALAIPTSQFTFYLRPPIFTFLYLAIYHQCFLNRNGHPPTVRQGIGLTVAMALWANLHGGAILGCVVVFLMGAGACLDRISDSERKISAGGRPIRGWISFGILVGLASLLNPYGIHLHLLTFEMMSQKWLTERITEMLPPRFDYLWTIPLLLIPASWGVWRKARWGERLVFLFLLWQGLSHVRHLPLLAIWAAPYAAFSFADRVRRPSRFFLAVLVFLPCLIGIDWASGWIAPVFLSIPEIRYAFFLFFAGVAVCVLARPKTGSRVFLIACVVAIGYVTIYPGARIAKLSRAIRGIEWESRNYPDKLVDLIVDLDIPGTTILNRENSSGYIIWRLAPERMRTFTCSRFDLQGSLPRMELETLLWCVEHPWSDPVSGHEIPPWKELWDKKYRFDLVILEKYSDRTEPFPFPLWTFLSTPGSGFVQVASEVYPDGRFPDQIFSLFVRNGPHLEEIVRKLGSRPLFRDGEN